MFVSARSYWLHLYINVDDIKPHTQNHKDRMRKMRRQISAEVNKRDAAPPRSKHNTLMSLATIIVFVASTRKKLHSAN